ncbi:DUF2541 family protein [Escherichia coli]|nr:DUF2541 family protein [Escherichia coli]
MKSVFTISASLAISLMLCCTAQANDHKLLGVIAMPRNETNALALKLPVCRIVKRIQLSADHGDLQLSGASVYFKAARSASQSLNIPSEIKEGQTTDWININSDNDNKRCVSKITFSGHTVNSSDMAYSAAIFLIPICISFDTAEKRRYATYLILNRRFSFEF